MDIGCAPIETGAKKKKRKLDEMRRMGGLQISTSASHEDIIGTAILDARLFIFPKCTQTRIGVLERDCLLFPMDGPVESFPFAFPSH